MCRGLPVKLNEVREMRRMIAVGYSVRYTAMALGRARPTVRYYAGSNSALTRKFGRKAGVPWKLG